MQNNGSLQRRVKAACLLIIAYSAGIGVIRLVGSEGEPGSLRISVSLVAPFVAAAVVALLAQRAGRGHFILAAGAGIIPVAAISIVSMPLWIPAVYLAVAGWKQLDRSETGQLAEMASSVLVTVGIYAAMIALLFRRDPLEWRDGTTEQYSDNTITASESLWSATILGLVIIVALLAVRTRMVEDPSFGGPSG